MISFRVAPTTALWNLAAFLTSGFWFLLARISFRVAPTTALWNLAAFLVFFLPVSSRVPFLCLRLYRAVQQQLSGTWQPSWSSSCRSPQECPSCAYACTEQSNGLFWGLTFAKRTSDI